MRRQRKTQDEARQSVVVVISIAQADVFQGRKMVGVGKVGSLGLRLGARRALLQQVAHSIRVHHKRRSGSCWTLLRR